MSAKRGGGHRSSVSVRRDYERWSRDDGASAQHRCVGRERERGEMAGTAPVPSIGERTMAEGWDGDGANVSVAG